MIKKILYVAAVILTLSLESAMYAEVNLPKVEILGKEYWFYEVKKGDSLYGIAKQFGWDPQELMRLNPEAAQDMEKGARVYYPTGNVIVLEKVESSQSEPMVFEPIQHKVKRGETVYSIARMYGVSVDTIYASHPSAKKSIREGEIITIKQNADSFDREGAFYYYTVKPGDTLFSLAKRYNTSVEDIMRDNPGVSESNFRIGDNVRLAVNSRKDMYRTQLVEESRVSSIGSYKVEKDDTWRTISQKTGASEEDLKNANGGWHKLKKNDVIAVPEIETVQVEKEVVAVDPREESSEGQQQIYDSIHSVEPEVIKLDGVRIAMLMEDASANREQEFARGFLLALDRLKNSGKKVSFKILDQSKSNSATIEELREFDPQVVITAHDKAFPVYLNPLSKETGMEIVNVFDVKSDEYENNPCVLQWLTPSNFFNDEAADFLSGMFEDANAMFVGEKDANDLLAESLRGRLNAGNILDLSASELASLPVSPSGDYMIYAYASDKKGMEQIVETVAKLRQENPSANISLIGRPNWIVWGDSKADQFFGANVFIPSRFYFDEGSSDGRRFNSSYNSMFGKEPMKSFPMYSVTGYDTANYLINSLFENSGDFNATIDYEYNGIQNDVDFVRVGNWGGFYNPRSYMIHYAPYRSVDKIMIGK